MDIKFDHIAFQVEDISLAVSWYLENVPGCRTLYQDSSWAFIEAGGVKLAFVIKDQHPGHLAWRVSDEDLEGLAIKHQKEIKLHRDGTRSFYLIAPGENWIEIISFPNDYKYV